MASAGAGARARAMLLACWGAFRDEPPDRIHALVERGWDHGRYLAEGGSVEVLPQRIGALVMCEKLDAAAEMVVAVRATARANGSVMHYLVASGHAAWIETRRGNLTVGAAEMRESLERALDAQRSGQARRIGVALRALGTLEQDRDAARSRLEQAVAVLAESPARLEHARALVELGAARRRHGNRVAARAPLREGLDQAARCGAIRLAQRARTELAATGARPRREYTTGRDALTPSELRVAQMAAEGHTSQEIAEALFVTTKTIDAHLSHTYTKLSIHSRKQLAAALEDQRN